MRSEVANVTGIVKYIGKSVFRHQNWGGAGGGLRPPFPQYSAAYVLERRGRVFKLFLLSISSEFSKSFGPV